MKRMLINATQPEELRVAIADGQKLLDLDIEIPSREQKKNNIYKGRITRIEPSLEAAFVDYGAERHGFLPLKEISREYFSEEAKEGRGKPDIRNAVQSGQEIIVQIDKEERGNKGAALTTFISLAGRYLVLMPNNSRVGGVSRQIAGDERKELREAMSTLEVPPEMGLIVRTAGVGRSAEELGWDLNDNLLRLWTEIKAAAAERKAPFLIFQESNLIIRALRDYLRSDIGEILIDRKDLFGEAQQFMQRFMPHNLRKLSLYEDNIPLFSRYQIESQIETVFAREVRLASGGSIVFDPTEALLSIDINSSKATKGSDIEETALNTNLEAADEIARQLRMRDLGGLIVVDFIDMASNKNQRLVEDRLRDAMTNDRARVQMGRISKFGLMEMSRQRLRPSLKESSQEVCPRCNGQGMIRSVESLALSILRLIEEEAMKENTGKIIVQVPNEVANFLLNEKRQTLVDIEVRQSVPSLIVANPHLVTPHFSVERVRSKDVEKLTDASYEMVAQSSDGAELLSQSGESISEPVKLEKPAVSAIVPETAAPVRTEEGLIKRFLLWLTGLFSSTEEKPNKRTKPNRRNRGDRSRGNEQNRNRNNRRGGQRGRQDDQNRNRSQQGKDDQRKSRSNRNNEQNRNSNKDQQRNQRNDRNKPEKNKQQNTQADKPNQQDANAAQREDGNEGGRRRRRGGRRRGGRRRNQENAGNQEGGNTQNVADNNTQAKPATTDTPKQAPQVDKNTADKNARQGSGDDRQQKPAAPQPKADEAKAPSQAKPANHEDKPRKPAPAKAQDNVEKASESKPREKKPAEAVVRPAKEPAKQAEASAYVVKAEKPPAPQAAEQKAPVSKPKTDAQAQSAPRQPKPAENPGAPTGDAPKPKAPAKEKASKAPAQAAQPNAAKPAPQAVKESAPAAPPKPAAQKPTPPAKPAADKPAPTPSDGD